MAISQPYAVLLYKYMDPTFCLSFSSSQCTSDFNVFFIILYFFLPTYSML